MSPGSLASLTTTAVLTPALGGCAVTAVVRLPRCALQKKAPKRLKSLGRAQYRTSRFRTPRGRAYSAATAVTGA